MDSFYKSLKQYTIWATIINILILLFIIGSCNQSHASINDETAVKCIIGEAGNQGEIGMYAVASALLNRGTIKGVYGCTAKFVSKEPAWVYRMALEALNKAKVKRLHPGTHWENIQAFGKPRWAYSMDEVYRYKDHVFYLERK